MTDVLLDLVVFAGQTLPWVFFAALIAWCVLTVVQQIAFRMRRYELAARAAEWVIRFPNHRNILAIALLTRGNTKYLRGDVEGASVDYEAALATRAYAPNPIRLALIGLASTLIELRRDPARASSLLDEAARMGEVPGRDLYSVHLLLLEGRVDEADAAFARSADSLPRAQHVVRALFDAWSLTWQGWYLVSRGRAADARTPRSRRGDGRRSDARGACSQVAQRNRPRRDVKTRSVNL